MTERTKVTAVGVVLSVLLIGSQGIGERVALAGDLEPPGPPSSTMKTLEQTTGAWDQVLPAAERFVLVMGGAAVLDKETGLVWEQSPLTTTHTWSLARRQCSNRTVGGRLGWLLPSVHELTSLIDLNNSGGNPDLPLGHPFSNVLWDTYWSASSDSVDPTRAWLAFIDASGTVATSNKTDSFLVWCVRGGGRLSEY